MSITASGSQRGWLIVGSVAACFLIIAGVAGFFSELVVSDEVQLTASAETTPLPAKTVSPASVLTLPASLPLAPVRRVAVVEKKTVAPRPRKKIEVGAHGYPIHSLDKRIDELSSQELEADLLMAREVSNFTSVLKMSPDQKTIFDEQQKALGKVNVHTVLKAQGHDELAGLPFQMGPETDLSRSQTVAMDLLSKA